MTSFLPKTTTHSDTPNCVEYMHSIVLWGVFSDFFSLLTYHPLGARYMMNTMMR